jgi:hypothetical protein
MRDDGVDYGVVVVEVVLDDCGGLPVSPPLGAAASR